MKDIDASNEVKDNLLLGTPKVMEVEQNHDSIISKVSNFSDSLPAVG